MIYFLRLLFHEIRVIFMAPASYTAAVLFLLLMGVMYIFILQEFASSPQEILPMQVFFSTFWVPVFFTVPLLTMKSLAEERRLGTLEALMTTPITASEIVISKFFASYLFYLVLWGMTLFFPWLASSVMNTGSSVAYLLDTSTLVGGYSFIAITGFLYIALGIFASSLTRSQLVAGMLSFSFLFFVILGGRLLESTPFISGISGLSPLVEYFETFRQLDDFSRGILDSRSLVLYFSFGFLMLGLTKLVVESKS